ncbi:extracellular serine-threonine rich protein [Histoplasma capsulatum var. duboisii H88]|uniref:Extracellular serine-threonine rich protein n=1 Tax=Ajellomyces capsulatus (strain H88) TaxID=544711 RepID=A0A8A1L6X5_AJEC8|nr:extracellular serine-threonine rich protein [Histoplasma capsulatum var. duboisii H88]
MAARQSHTENPTASQSLRSRSPSIKTQISPLCIPCRMARAANTPLPARRAAQRCRIHNAEGQCP